MTNFVINLQTICLLPSGLSFKKNRDIEYTFKCLAEYWRWCPGLPNRAALAFHSLVADKNKIFTNLTRRKKCGVKVRKYTLQIMSKHKIKQQVLYFSSSHRYDHLSNFNLKGIFIKKTKKPNMTRSIVY